LPFDAAAAAQNISVRSVSTLSLLAIPRLLAFSTLYAALCGLLMAATIYGSIETTLSRRGLSWLGGREANTACHSGGLIGGFHWRRRLGHYLPRDFLEGTRRFPSPSRGDIPIVRLF
jgi:hypothetical protein